MFRGVSAADSACWHSRSPPFPCSLILTRNLINHKETICSHCYIVEFAFVFSSNTYNNLFDLPENKLGQIIGLTPTFMQPRAIWTAATIRALHEISQSEHSYLILSKLTSPFHLHFKPGDQIGEGEPGQFFRSGPRTWSGPTHRLEIGV